MARRFTIRTKLVTGLVLVLGISAVLTANTLFGLYSFRSLMRAFDSKTRELPLGSELWDRVAQLDHPDTPRQFHTADDAGATFEDRIALVEKALADYKTRLNRTLDRGRDPDAGRAELDLLTRIDTQMAELRALPPYPYWADDEQWLMDAAVGGPHLTNRRIFREHVAALSDLVKSLPVPTYRDMKSLAGDAQASFHTNLWIAWSTGALVLVLLVVLSRLSYFWIFRPIRHLYDSVQRVGQGDLSHRIRLSTGDEMQELAEAFNHMTARLEEICRDLERQVEVRSRQLVRSEHLASVGFLAAGVAHEINNPLASISFSSEALQRRLKRLVPASGGDADDVWRCLTMIQTEAFRCKGITERLLDFSRLGDHQRQPTKLTDLVADVIDIVQHMGRYRSKQIMLAGSSDVVGRVNPQEVKQVVLNLVVNALDSMEADGTLAIDVHEEPPHAVLEFTDDGCGMTADVLQNIFEPFFTRSRTGKGTGLGLSISHRIITEHGGQIEASSDGPGRGSRFTVRLPLAQASVKEDQGHVERAA